MLGRGQHDDNPNAVVAMLRHIYGLPYYRIEVGGFSSTVDQAMFHVDTYIVADKYDVPAMRSRVVHKLRGLIARYGTKLRDFGLALQSIWSLEFPPTSSANIKAMFVDAVIKDTAAVVVDQPLRSIIGSNDLFLQDLLLRMKAEIDAGRKGQQVAGGRVGRPEVLW